MANALKLAHHLETLQKKHRELDSTIEVLYAERVNDSVINNRKLEKLRLKEEITKVQDQLKETDNGA